MMMMARVMQTENVCLKNWIESLRDVTTVTKLRKNQNKQLEIQRHIIPESLSVLTNKCFELCLPALFDTLLRARLNKADRYIIFVIFNAIHPPLVANMI